MIRLKMNLKAKRKKEAKIIIKKIKSIVEVCRIKRPLQKIRKSSHLKPQLTSKLSKQKTIRLPQDKLNPKLLLLKL